MNDNAREMDQMLILVKPHAVRAGHANEIMARLERYFRIEVQVLMEAEEATVRRHYAAHEGAAYYESTVASMIGPVMVAIIEVPKGQIPTIRRDLIGTTDPNQAALRTIRSDFGEELPNNAIHASDSPEAAEEEIRIWLERPRWVEYDRTDLKP